jgi:enoyl-CoA hydratase/carnithine racemase
MAEPAVAERFTTVGVVTLAPKGADAIAAFVAAEGARFGVSEARWSLYPMGGSAVRLARQIPYTVAADILLTGKHISGQEAKEIGLVGDCIELLLRNVILIHGDKEL